MSDDGTAGGTEMTKINIEDLHPETFVRLETKSAPSSMPAAPGALLQNTGASGHFRYRPDIDGLRSVAVLAVVFYHLEHAWLPGGFVGVDIFFVISGFVVSGSLLSKQHDSALSFISAFYSRRVKRLVPALVLMVLTISTLSLLLLSPRTTPQLKEHLLSGMLAMVGFANIHFSMMPKGYFDEGAEALEYNPFTHCWSLGVEEQFYMLFPMLTLLAYGRLVSRAAPTMVTRLVPPSAPLVLCGLASATISAVQSGASKQQLAAFYLLPSRFWQLMAGALLFHVQTITAVQNHLRIPSRVPWALILDISGSVLIVAGVIATPSSHNFPMPWSLLAVAGSLCLIAAGCYPPTLLLHRIPSPLVGSLLATRVPVYIGKISYPLYLWHWPVFVLFKWTCGLRSPQARTVALLATLVLTCLTYHGVEGIARRWRPPERWRIFAVFLPAVALTEAWLAMLRGPLFGALSDIGGPVEEQSALNVPPMATELTPAARLISPPSEPPRLPSMPPLPPRIEPHLPPIPPFIPPSPHPPPMCSAPTSDVGSVYDTAQRWLRMDGTDGDAAKYSTYTSRGCSCLRDAATIHRAPGETTDPSAPPCFVERSPDNEPSFTREVGPLAQQQSSFGGCLLDLNEQDCGGNCEDEDNFARLEIPMRVNRCLIPGRSGPYPQRAIFLLGDSHAASLAPGLMAAVDGAAHVSWISLPWGVIWSCDFHNERNSWRFRACEQERQEVDRVLREQVRACDVVVITHLRDQWTDERSSRETSATNARRNLAIFQTQVRSLGAKLVIIGDVPALPINPRHCIPSAFRPDAVDACRTPALVGDAIDDVEYKALASADAGVYYMSTYGLFCDPARSSDGCGAVVPGTSTFAYADENHLNVAGSLYLWPHLCAFFRSNGLLGGTTVV